MYTRLVRKKNLATQNTRIKHSNLDIDDPEIETRFFMSKRDSIFTLKKLIFIDMW